MIRILTMFTFCIMTFSSVYAQSPELPLVIESSVVSSGTNIGGAVKKRRKSFFAIKTNIAMLGAGVSNLGVEYGFGRHYSIDLPFIYSPYSISPDYRIKVLALQPEFRFWFARTMRGHFIGLHGGVCWYNVALKDKPRYQDNRPMWEVGFSYGYNLPVSKHWNLEFTIGEGYMDMSYDTYYNKENGAKYGSDRRRFWGITKLGFSLIYKFNLK